MSINARREEIFESMRRLPGRELSVEPSLPVQDNWLWFVGYNLIIWCKMSNPLKKEPICRAHFPGSMANSAKGFPHTQGGGVLDFLPFRFPVAIRKSDFRNLLYWKDYNLVFHYGSGIKHLFIPVSYEGANVELSSFDGLTKPCIGPGSFWCLVYGSQHAPPPSAHPTEIRSQEQVWWLRSPLLRPKKILKIIYRIYMVIPMCQIVL